MTSRSPWFHTASVKRRTSTFCCSAVMLPPLHLHLHPEPLHVPQVDCVTVSLPVHPGPEMAAYCVPTAVRPTTWAGGLGYDVSKRRVGTCRTHDVSLPPSSRRKDRRRGRSPRRFTLPRTRCRITSRRSLIRWVYAVGAS